MKSLRFLTSFLFYLALSIIRSETLPLKAELLADEVSIKMLAAPINHADLNMVRIIFQLFSSHNFGKQALKVLFYFSLNLSRRLKVFMELNQTSQLSEVTREWESLLRSDLLLVDSS
jgi:hypothetical protein